jgi:DNA repair protein RadA/Sms
MHRLKKSSVPSSDPLSATITSPPIRSICPTTCGSRSVSRSRPLRDGITTETPRGRVSGACVFAGIEGTRPLLVEIQALVAPSSFATPRHAVVGWDTNRLAMVLAVLEARCGVAVGANDVYLNVAGGLRIGEPAADLAVAAAVVSSLADEPVPPDMVVFGEIGLGGEVRPVSQREARLREAAKLGFRSALVPRGRAGSGPTPRAPEGIAIDEIEHLADLVARFQPAERPLKRARREGSSDRGRE